MWLFAAKMRYRSAPKSRRQFIIFPVASGNGITYLENFLGRLNESYETMIETKVPTGLLLRGRTRNIEICTFQGNDSFRVVEGVGTSFKI